MALVNEQIVLDYYLEQINADSIKFLMGKDRYKKEIVASIKMLRDETAMHNRIEIAKELWKQLFEASMSYISKDKKGYDDIFKFFDEYVNFEELIFASDAFYRDHTLHCLWVYFLGEYLARNENYKGVFDKKSEKAISIVTNLKNVFDETKHKKYFKETITLFEDLLKNIENGDCIRCVSALTHDLGYPIKKISKINKSMKNILPYFAIHSYDEFSFNYSDIQLNYINDFLRMLSDDISVDVITNQDIKDNEELIDKYFIIDWNAESPIKFKEEAMESITEDELIKMKIIFMPRIDIFTNVSNHARHSSDFEQYEHGIMSAFLLMRNISIFNTIEYKYAETKSIHPRNVEFFKLTTMQEILRSISNHTSPRYQMTDVKEYSDFLIFMDELEEFSRISRANQNRSYISEFCKTDISMQEGYFQVDFIFDNRDFDGLDPEKAFKGRCKRFLTLFDIENIEESLKIRLRCIGKLPYDNNIYTLEIAKNYANILINDEEQDIPKYLKSKIFYTKEEYSN